MKLRNIFTILASALILAFVGCEEPERFLEEVKVSKSYISLPMEGGEVKIEVDAVSDWSIVAWDADDAKIVEIPEWLTIDPISGPKGKSEITFSAAATTENNVINLHLNCGAATQVLKVVQFAEQPEPELKTCDWINTNGEDGVTYRAQGVVTLVNSTYAKYGGFTINDGTANLIVYGSDGNTAYPDLAVGDEVVVEGPWATQYTNFGNGTVVISVVKSLIKVEKVSPSSALAKEGDVISVALTCKGEGLEIRIPEEAQSWLTASEPLVLENAIIVEFTVAANEGGARSTTVTFVTNSAGVEYTAKVDIQQLGGIMEATVADFLAAAEGPSLFKLTGKVANLKPGNYGNFDLVDGTGSVYVYGLTATPVEKNDQSFPTLNIKEGDIVTLIGTRASHNGTAQVGGPAYYVSHVGNTVVTVEEFLAKEVNSDTRYMLTGTVKNIVMDKDDPTKQSEYGNFDLEDETGSVYVYGLTVAPVAKNDKSFPKLEIEEGDVITIVGTRAAYNNNPQVGGPAYFIEKQEAPAPETKGFSETFNESLGEFTIENKTTLADGAFVWAHSTYSGAGYAKGSGYNIGAAESWLISPEIDLAGMTMAKLQFEHALNFLNGATATDHIALMVKKGDAEWTAVTIPTFPDGASYDYVSSGEIDLASYVGSKIKIAFKYVSTADIQPSWQIRNLKVE